MEEMREIPVEEQFLTFRDTVVVRFRLQCLESLKERLAASFVVG